MSDNIREIFVKNLRFLMDAKGVTQSDICRELNVSSATASDWCNGKKFPRADAVERLADLLGVRVSILVTEDGLKSYEDDQRIEALHQNPRLCLLFDRTRKMSSADVETMLAVSASILKELDGDE